MEDNPSPFIVREIPWNPYEYCGRMIIRDGLLVIFIDGTGRFDVPVSEGHGIRPGTGPGEESSWSGRKDEFVRDRKKGIWIQIQGKEYVTPAERVRKVIRGEH